MAAHPDRPPQVEHVQTQDKAIEPKEVTKVYRTLGLDNEEARRKYLEWSSAGQSEPKTTFEIVERGDTLTFE